MHVDRIAPAADRLAFLGQRSLLGDVARIRVQVRDALGHDRTLGILPRALADAIARIDAFGAARLGRAEVGAPVCKGRTRRLCERLTMGIGAGKSAEIGAVALAGAAYKECHGLLRRHGRRQAQSRRCNGCE